MIYCNDYEANLQVLENKIILITVIIKNIKQSCNNNTLTHSALEYFEKLAFKKIKHATLNSCISKARSNSELKLTFSESSFNFFNSDQYKSFP